MMTWGVPVGRSIRNSVSRRPFHTASAVVSATSAARIVPSDGADSIVPGSRLHSLCRLLGGARLEWGGEDFPQRVQRRPVATTRNKCDLSRNHQRLIDFPSVDSLQHLRKLAGLLFPGLKDAVGAISAVLSGAPDQATSGPPGKEPAPPIMLNDFHTDLTVDQR